MGYSKYQILPVPLAFSCLFFLWPLMASYGLLRYREAASAVAQATQSTGVGVLVLAQSTGVRVLPQSNVVRVAQARAQGGCYRSCASDCYARAKVNDLCNILSIRGKTSIYKQNIIL